jgi:hypothetical protein
LKYVANDDDDNDDDDDDDNDRSRSWCHGVSYLTAASRLNMPLSTPMFFP